MMFGRKPKVVNAKLDDAMINLLDGMDTYGSDCEEYPVLLGYLEKVSVLRKSEDPKRRVSADQRAFVIGNILTVLIIVMYEQKHVMTSKGLGFVLRNKN
jgi:hypothetical protein